MDLLIGSGNIIIFILRRSNKFKDLYVQKKKHAWDG